MNDKKSSNTETVRPLAFQLARELTQQEIDAIAGAGGGAQTTWVLNPPEATHREFRH